MVWSYDWGEPAVSYNEPVEFEKQPVEVQNCKKFTNYFRGIHRIYPNLIKGNRRIWTCNRLGLQTLWSQPVMPKNLPDHWCKASKGRAQSPNPKEHSTWFLAQNNPSNLTANILSMIEFFMKRNRPPLNHSLGFHSCPTQTMVVVWRIERLTFWFLAIWLVEINICRPSATVWSAP